MIKATTYHSDWQHNRINFILSKYPKEFFNGKRILELGAHNGYIGAYFSTLGADVHCIEGRPENVEKIIETTGTDNIIFVVNDQIDYEAYTP